MSRDILLIGGPKHGEKITIEDSPTFKHQTSNREAEVAATYTVCQSGDGQFYAVFEPKDDPSIRRIQNLRNQILGAME